MITIYRRAKVSIDIPSIVTPGLSVHIGIYTILVWIVVRLVAGLIASRLMLGHGLGFTADVIVGILGALLGGFLAGVFGIQVVVPGHPVITQILIALFGALILLLILRVLGLGRRRRRVPCARRGGEAHRARRRGEGRPAPTCPYRVRT